MLAKVRQMLSSSLLGVLIYRLSANMIESSIAAFAFTGILMDMRRS